MSSQQACLLLTLFYCEPAAYFLSKTLLYQLPSAVPFSKCLFFFDPILRSFASSFIARMTAPTSLGGRRYFDGTLLNGLVDIFHSTDFGRKFQISSLSMKKLSQVGCRGGLFFFAAIRIRAEGKDRESKVAQTCHSLRSLG